MPGSVAWPEWAWERPRSNQTTPKNRNTLVKEETDFVFEATRVLASATTALPLSSSTWLQSESNVETVKDLFVGTKLTVSLQWGGKGLIRCQELIENVLRSAEIGQLDVCVVTEAAVIAIVSAAGFRVMRADLAFESRIHDHVVHEWRQPHVRRQMLKEIVAVWQHVCSTVVAVF